MSVPTKHRYAIQKFRDKNQKSRSNGLSQLFSNKTGETRKHRITISLNPWMRKTIGLVVIGCALFFGYKYAVVQFMRVANVEVNGLTDTEKEKGTQAVLSKVQGKNLYLLNDQTIKPEIEFSLPNYRFVSAKKVFPQKMVVNLEKRTPLFYVGASNGTFLIDGENFVMDSAGSYLGFDTKIKYDQNLQIGTRITDPIFITATAFVSDQTVLNIQDNILSIKLEDGGTVYLPENNQELKNYQEVAALLQKIIQKYRIENREIELIDLRYSKPLIKYKEENQ